MSPPPLPPPLRRPAARGIRWRLTLSLLLVFVLGLGAVAAFSHLEMRWAEKRLSRRTLESHARELLAGLSVTDDGRVAIALLPDWEEPYRQPGAAFAFTLYDSTGRPVVLSPNIVKPLPLFEIPSQAVHGRMHELDANGRVALAARAPDGHTLVVARGRLDQETLAAIFLDEAAEFLAVFLLFAAAAFALIWLIVGWSLRPLAEAAREAAAVGPANPSGRLSVDGLPSEIRPLVGAVNGALERLDRAYAAQKRLTADAAHELRTPLTVLGLRLQRAKLHGATDWPAVEADLANMKRLVDQLMNLARKEDPTRGGEPAATAADALAAAAAPVNLSRVVREAAAMVLPLAEGNGRAIEVEAPDVVPVRGRADDLRDAVRNLLDNALAHGAGTVRVRVSPASPPTAPAGAASADLTPGRAERQEVLVEVADEGAGIPEDLREAVFDRFRKAVAASPGAGLGLAIVRHVARAHGGDARVRPGGGPGCGVEISLPAAG